MFKLTIITCRIIRRLIFIEVESPHLLNMLMLSPFVRIKCRNMRLVILNTDPYKRKYNGYTDEVYYQENGLKYHIFHLNNCDEFLLKFTHELSFTTITDYHYI